MAQASHPGTTLQAARNGGACGQGRGDARLRRCVAPDSAAGQGSRPPAKTVHAAGRFAPSSPKGDAARWPGTPSAKHRPGAIAGQPAAVDNHVDRLGGTRSVLVDISGTV